MTGPVVFQILPDWQKPMMPGVVRMLQGLGSEMVAEMADLVPEGTRSHTGPNLKDTLFSRVVQSRGARGTFGQNQLEVGADADYALDVEFGHLTVNGETFVEAQPFIRPVVYKFHDGKTQIAPGGGSDFEGNPALSERS